MIEFKLKPEGAIMAGTDAETPASDASGEAKRPVRSPDEQARARLLIAGVAIVLIALFAVTNTQQVTIHWIFTTTHSPLIVAIVAWTVIGAVAGAVVGRMRRRRAARASRD
jgi:uncharacterized integral membrane protein